MRYSILLLGLLACSDNNGPTALSGPIECPTCPEDPKWADNPVIWEVDTTAFLGAGFSEFESPCNGDLIETGEAIQFYERIDSVGPTSLFIVNIRIPDVPNQDSTRFYGYHAVSHVRWNLDLQTDTVVSAESGLSFLPGEPDSCF